MCWHYSRRPEGHYNICSNICSKRAQALTKNVPKNMLNYIFNYLSNCPTHLHTQLHIQKFIHSQSRQDIVQVHCICIAISRCPEGVLTRGRHSPKGRPHTKVYLRRKKVYVHSNEVGSSNHSCPSISRILHASQHKPRLMA